MTTVSIHEARTKLAELIHGLQAGEEVIITDNDQPVARLVAVPGVPQRKPRQPGTAKGVLLIHVEDDTHLDDFKEYMP